MRRNKAPAARRFAKHWRVVDLGDTRKSKTAKPPCEGRTRDASKRYWWNENTGLASSAIRATRSTRFFNKKARQAASQAGGAT